MASKVLKAQVTIDEFQTSIMDKHQLKDFVERNIFAQMSDTVMNEIAIEKSANPNIGTNTYTGTLHVGASTISGYNGTMRDSPNTPNNELRVIEYTKNGKVTKVELQMRTNDGWRRVPRIQIEETTNV